jgi:predicted GNAT superfamily acetyltransferase
MSAAEAVAAAWRAAASAARQAGVDVTVLRHPDEFRAAAALFGVVWATSPEAGPGPADLLRALSHAGNYVAGAWRDGVLAGCSAGFLGLAAGPAAAARRLRLHSHVTGVLPDGRGAGVGFALKQHQRAWALERGITEVGWTFDPLIRRNAFFNLVKLGAEVVAYEPRFYGEMADGINAGDESDRCVVRWRLLDDRVAVASQGVAVEPDAALVEDAAVVLREGERGEPVADDAALAGALTSGGPAGAGVALRCWVPADLVAVRGSDPARALAWRRGLRATMGEAMRAGWTATGMTRAGWYLLTR